MTNRPCSVSLEALLAWRDGELSPWRRARLGRHIERCAQCQQEIALMNQITHELREDEAQSKPMPAELRERILSALPDQAAAPNAVSPASTSTAQLTSAAPVGAHKIKPRAPWIERGALAGAGALAMLVAMSVWGPRAPGAFNGVPDTLAVSQSEGAPGDASDTFSSGGSAGVAGPVFSLPNASPSAGSVGAAFPIQEAQAQFKRAEASASAARSLMINGSGGGNLYANTLTKRESSERQVHKDARIGVGVADAEESAASVESLAKNVGGFVATTTVSTDRNGLRSASLSVRVPVKKFEDVMSQIGQMGRLLSKSVSGEDITARLSGEARRRQVLAGELKAQETVLKAALARENAALRRAEAAGREGYNFEVPWEDRQRVRNLRARAAQSKAQLEALRLEAEMSEIEVELRERRTAPGQASFSQEMRQTASLALSSFAVALRAPFTSLIWILAFAPLWLPAILLYRFAIKRLRSEEPGA